MGFSHGIKQDKGTLIRSHRTRKEVRVTGGYPRAKRQGQCTRHSDDNVNTTRITIRAEIEKQQTIPKKENAKHYCGKVLRRLCPHKEIDV
jgi:hypothetical protein